jgi:hypothetical protein
MWFSASTSSSVVYKHNPVLHGEETDHFSTPAFATPTPTIAKEERYSLTLHVVPDVHAA